VELKFENTDENNRYSIWSYVKWGKEYIKCERLDIDIIGLWCSNRNLHYHFEFLEDGTFVYRELGYEEYEVYEESYSSWSFVNGNSKVVDINCYDDPYKIEKLDADSLVLKELYMGDIDVPTVYRFHRIKNNNECYK